MVVVKEKVRSEIVSVASKIFSRHGFRKTTMDQIADATKMGKSSIYYYFKSKEDIFAAVVVKEAQELKYALQEVVRSGATPIDRLKDYIRFRLYHVKAVSNFYEAMKDESNVKMEFVAKIRKRFEEQEYKMLKEILETGIQEGAFKLTDSGIGAVAIMTMMKGLEIPLFLNEYSRTKKEKLLDDLMNVVFYGLIKRQ
jgi:AcrR family transcriptional regulator